MTLAKAKDYFSAYHEGSLDRGLKQAFETRLREDTQLQAEYRAFERTMKELEAFGCVEVEPPSDLHDKIAARLDKAIWDQKRQKNSGVKLRLVEASGSGFGCGSRRDWSSDLQRSPRRIKSCWICKRTGWDPGSLQVLFRGHLQ